MEVHQTELCIEQKTEKSSRIEGRLDGDGEKYTVDSPLFCTQTDRNVTSGWNFDSVMQVLCVLGQRTYCMPHLLLVNKIKYLSGVFFWTMLFFEMHLSLPRHYKSSVLHKLADRT